MFLEHSANIEKFVIECSFTYWSINSNLSFNIFVQLIKLLSRQQNFTIKLKLGVRFLIPLSSIYIELKSVAKKIPWVYRCKIRLIEGLASRIVEDIDCLTHWILLKFLLKLLGDRIKFQFLYLYPRLGILKHLVVYILIHAVKTLFFLNQLREFLIKVL